MFRQVRIGKNFCEGDQVQRFTGARHRESDTIDSTAVILQKEASNITLSLFWMEV